MAVKTRALPDCWGHRGASAAYPENTLASFEAAMRDGAEGIESDVHVSIDDVVIMFHDPVLQRTTNGKGYIKELNWYGSDGMEHLRTTQLPEQSIPTFAETVQLLMLPENIHVKFNVDVKVQNSPTRLFGLMSKIISAQPDWETALAPRILLGLWHPRFLQPAKSLLPYCRRSYIGLNTYVARKYFWNDCSTFSIAFAALVNADGQQFISECKTQGKQLMVWTVNEPDEMMESVRWGVDGILTDYPRRWLEMRSALQTDYDGEAAMHGRAFLWKSLKFYRPTLFAYTILWQKYLESEGGSFDATFDEDTSFPKAPEVADLIAVTA